MIIGHYTPGLEEPGGIAAYIRQLGHAQQAAGHEVLFLDLLRTAKSRDRRAEIIYCENEAEVPVAALRRGAQVLHVHRDFLLGDAPPMSIIRTIHDHTPYCPSGGRFLKRSDRPCNRGYSLGGCLWGRAIDRCGSMRPAALISDFATTRHERRRLPHITTIVSSQFVQRQMLRAGYDPARLVHLTMAAPAAAARVVPLPESPRFLFLGRMVPHKGLAWLLGNMALLPRNIHLDIAGEGNDLDAMKKLAADLKLNERVTFHGWIDRETTQRLLDAATALIVPSRWHEPFGLVTLEAMARGRAVIASDAGALPEIVLHGETGLIVPTEQAHGLADAMRQLADRPEMAMEMGLAGWRLVGSQYQMDAHLRRILELYQQCIAA
jgi:glycosyltransferase involved in cell wall biosynthesis